MSQTFRAVPNGTIRLTSATVAGSTGVVAYFSNGSWRRLSDDTAVAA